MIFNYRKIEHGITILATGAQEWKPNEYRYGEDPWIVTQLELEDRIVTQPDQVAQAKHIVMIQCVGSRNKERPNCSRTCCATAVKNALKIKAMNPHINISILYRDIAYLRPCRILLCQRKRTGDYVRPVRT